MATTPTNVDAWIPEEMNGPVIQAIKKTSAVEDLAASVPMSTLTRKIPRDGGVDFEGATPKSTAIAKDQSDNDTILLTARKLARIIEFSEEDLADTAQVADAIKTKQLAWASSYAKGFDNATLGVTAVENGTTVPFTSLYKVLSTTDTNLPDEDYTAGDNIVVVASGGLSYDDISDAMALVEDSDWFDEGNMVWIASPAFKKSFRDLKDANDRPLFDENSKQADGVPDRLKGYPIRWTQGARKSAVSTNKPQGAPLMFFGNKEMLKVGKRSGPEYMVAPSDSGPAFETDDTLIKFRTRRAFGVGHPRAWVCVEGL